MKNNKILLFLAMFNIVSAILKILIGFTDVYMIPQGWVTGLVIDVLSVYIIVTSEVKHKWICFFISAMFFAAVVLLLGLLSMYGLVQQGW